MSHLVPRSFGNVRSRHLPSWFATALLASLLGSCSNAATTEPTLQANWIGDADDATLQSGDADPMGADTGVPPDPRDGEDGANDTADGSEDVGVQPGTGCYTCHGKVEHGNPAPPWGTQGEKMSNELAVGAHQIHLGASDWHRQVQCNDCHVVPTDLKHSNKIIDYAWSSVATAMGSTPSFDPATATCTGAYCHGGKLFDAAKVATKPVWTQVDGTFNACSTNCHLTPPGGPHPQKADCASCHGAVIVSFDAQTQEAVWKDPALHVNGVIDVQNQTCTTCHGDATTKNPAPPLGTKGETKTTELAVGAHAQHLAASDWHRPVLCTDCHVVPTAVTHANGIEDFAWGPVAVAAGASPQFSAATATCSGVYCHGTKLANAGTAKTQPVWTQVDGTFHSCGAACHMTPPAAPHSPSTDCALCHGTVIASFDAKTQKATWKSAPLHINGQIDVKDLTCTSCHGDATTKNPAPPTGTKGETKTSELAVGAHAQHLAASTWHRTVACTDCHAVPVSTAHSNGTVDFSWSAVASALGAAPQFDATSATCTGAYCHGVKLAGAATAKTQPVWTQVDGSFKGCGSSCHSTPPSGTHPQNNNCVLCHGAVIAAVGDLATGAVTWANAALHIDGIIQSSKYHTLATWTAPKFNPNGSANSNHHGFGNFLSKHGVDDKGQACTSCHGADYSGGAVNVSCNNSAVNCHGANPAGGTGGDWHACNFCHGSASANVPPTGVANEATNQTLAVGRHAAHLASSTTHVAFTCDRCHVAPAAGDLAHTQQYAPSTDLSTPGHHGDVAFPTPPTDVNSTGAMLWDVTGVLGTPVTARGTCSGACHSNGRGASPLVTPRWAGGTWNVGNCASCHAAVPKTGHHSAHTSGKNNVYCTTCHPDAASASHVNGLRDVNTTITGAPYTGNITSSRPKTGGCSKSVQCSGTCHGEQHSAECW